MAEFILPYHSGSVIVTSCFGWRTLNRVQDYHKGIDLCGSDKTLVSPCGGVIGSSTIIYDKSNTTWEWGNYIRIDRDDGLQIFMCHMAERKVAVGQVVKAGDIVGIEGNTGSVYPTPKGENDKTTGRHCHFEVRKNGVSVDPTPYLGIANASGTYQVNTPDYAALVCRKCGLEAQTKAYLDKYKYASDLWRKLWEAMG